MTKILRSFLLCAVLAQLTACGVYRMPTDDDIALVPTTNNPEVVEDKSGSVLMPGFAL